jgi:hypothetical protein
MPGSQDFDDIWDLSGVEPEKESGRKAEHEGAAEKDEETRRSAANLGSSPADSELSRRLQWANDDHKRKMEVAKAEFEREMERYKATHDRRTNYAILAVVSILFLGAVSILSIVAYQVNNENTLRDKAITLLAPLTGLALGFLSGKVKWPVL